MASIEIVNRVTDEVEQVIETEHLSGTTNYGRLLDGLYRKVDFERFYIREIPG